MTAQKSIETTYCAVVTITGNNLQYLSDNVADPSKFCSNPDQSCQNIPEYFKSAKLFYKFMFLLKKKTDLILQKFTKTYLCPFMRTSFNICSGFIIINNISVRTQVSVAALLGSNPSSCYEQETGFKQCWTPALFLVWSGFGFKKR